MFLNEYKHSIDAKNRLFLPSKFREELGDVIYLVKSIDKCISVYPKEAWQKFIEKLEALPQIKARQIRRFIFSSAVETEIDSQGRILIPQNLREYAGIEKNARVIGVGDYIEIWADEALTEEMDNLDNNEMINELIELGF